MKNEKTPSYETFNKFLVKPLYDLAMVVPFDQDSESPYDMLEYVARAAKDGSTEETFGEALIGLIYFHSQGKYIEFRTIFDQCDTQGFFWDADSILILDRLFEEVSTIAS